MKTVPTTPIRALGALLSFALLAAPPALSAQEPPAPPPADTAAAKAAADTASAEAAGAPGAEPAEPAVPKLTADLLEPFRFRFIGPVNQSGRITAIAVPESDRKTIYFSFASGGVWKSTNAGVTWRPVFDGQGFASIGDVAVAPSDPDVVWVGTGERNSLRSNGWGDGVYRSTDGGRTWKRMGLEQTRETGRIAIHPKDPDIVYVAALGHLWGADSARGVYRTTDGGESWEKVLFVNDTTGFVDLKMDPSNPDVLYAASWHRIRWGGGRMEGAGSGSGIWKTTNGGRTWKRLTDPALDNGLPTRKLGRIGLAVHPKNPKLVFAVIQAAHGAVDPNISPHGGLFRSEDGGETWTRIHDYSAVPDYYYNEVWLDPNDPDRLWLAGTYLQLSTDGGRTVKPLRMRQVHVDHHAMWVDPSDSRHILLGNDGGLYESFDGGSTWRHHKHPSGQFYEVDVDTTKVPYHVCGGLQDNGTWCGPSRTRERVGITERDWYHVFGGDGFRHAVSPDSPSIRYGIYQFGSLARIHVDQWEIERIQPHAEDAGAESGYEFRWDWNSPFMISHHDPKTLYFGGNHLFKLKDRGRDWEILGPDMTRQSRTNPEPVTAHTGYGSLHSIAESPLDPDVIWTGSNDGLIWVTTDGGRTWRNVTENIPDEAPRRCFVAEIEASRFDRSTAYVAYDCHRRDDYRPWVFRTTDAGGSWTNITGNLPDDAGSWVVREGAYNPDLLFVGTERGLWVSITGGGEWVRIRNDLPTVAVRDVDVVRQEKELVVGTFGRSVYILDIGPLEELKPEVLSKAAHLFEVKPTRTFNLRNTYESFGDAFPTADNPPYGAVITYYLREDQGKDVTLTIRKPAGEPVVAARASGGKAGGAGGARPDGGEKASGQGEGGEQGEVVTTITSSGRPGMHRVVWDLRAREPRPRALGDPTSPDALREVLPGTYTVTLKAGGETLTREIVVEKGWVEHLPGRVR